MLATNNKVQCNVTIGNWFFCGLEISATYLFFEAQIVTAIHSQMCTCVAVFNPLTALSVKREQLRTASEKYRSQSSHWACYACYAMAASHALHLGISGATTAGCPCSNDLLIKHAYQARLWRWSKYWHNCEDKAFSQGPAIRCCSGEGIQCYRDCKITSSDFNETFSQAASCERSSQKQHFSFHGYDCSLFASHSTRVCKTTAQATNE